MLLSPSATPQDLGLCAALWSQLPRESRCVKKHNPEALWSDAENLLWSIEHSLRVLVWRNVTRDGQKGRRMPKPITRPSEHAENERRKEHALANKKEIAKALGIKEV